MQVEALLMPRGERLSAKVRRQGMSTADYLAFFDRQVRLGSAWISGNRIELCAHRKLEYLSDDVIGAIGSRSAATGWRFSFDDIADGFKWCIGAHVEHDRVL